jgi:hypothetical protein
MLRAIFITLIVIIEAVIPGKASTCTASTGNWNSPGTWSCGYIPGTAGFADVVIIPTGVTVTVTGHETPANDIDLTISGTLVFNGGKWLNMTVNSSVSVTYTSPAVYGVVTGGNGGTRFQIGAKTIYTPGTPIHGPASASSTIGLPIAIVRFSVYKKSDKMQLIWTTASEINNDYFTIEKTQDGIYFETVAKVKGAGNSDHLLRYEIMDDTPYDGLSYYRLTQTDFDGKQTAFDLIPANNQNYNLTFRILPNPSDGRNVILSFNYEGMVSQEVTIYLYNSLGEMIYTDKIYFQKEDFSFHLNPDKKLMPGSYILLASSKYGVSREKLIIF